MTEIKLKHYKSYLRRLEKFARMINLEVEYKEENAHDAVYIPSRSKIRIDDDLEQSTVIAVFLHELGHALDANLADQGVHRKIDRAYDALANEKVTPSQFRLVLKTEQTAWNNGRMLAAKLKISLGAWYDEAEKYYLNTYRKARS